MNSPQGEPACAAFAELLILALHCWSVLSSLLERNTHMSGSDRGSSTPAAARPSSSGRAGRRATDSCHEDLRNAE